MLSADVFNRDGIKKSTVGAILGSFLLAATTTAAFGIGKVHGQMEGHCKAFNRGKDSTSISAVLAEANTSKEYAEFSVDLEAPTIIGKMTHSCKIDMS